MNNLMTESFERVMGRYPGEGGDNDPGNGFSPDTRDMGMKGFQQQVDKIEKQIDVIESFFQKLQASNEESKHLTKASAMKEIKEEMEKNVDKVRQTAMRIKTMLEDLDRENLANRRKPGCEKGTAVDRSRTAMTVLLKKKLKEKMSQFQTLRQNIQEDYREVVERRVFTVTGARPDEEMIENLIETGNSEEIFTRAIQGHGRGEIMDTLAEIQERRDTVLEIERKLVDLQQTFMDMAVLVDAQGEMLDDIEAQVATAVDHVQKATVSLKKAKEIQKNSRKWTCLAIIILLIVIIAAVIPILKDMKQS